MTNAPKELDRITGGKMNIPILKPAARVVGRVTICRSFAYKLNAGGYESRDFFCSQSAECDAEDAAEISERVYQFCKAQVMRAVNDYMAEQKIRKQPQLQRRTA